MKIGKWVGDLLVALLTAAPAIDEAVSEGKARRRERLARPCPICGQAFDAHKRNRAPGLLKTADGWVACGLVAKREAGEERGGD